ncbi:YwqJ-related putative deaminase [Xenorhabdus khoisanae]|uniref:YwqJ-related putative deaminase n=1 Tax=Xenorhabdus khoisanae TaxID=880157 RepID=UPI0023586321|nr:YwqJ-related putative deaminase [Xenorhabdus khoisanae]MDC9614002.1 YwqJ-related putative deaminase [Xenorhabdus khoisanae]
MLIYSKYQQPLIKGLEEKMAYSYDNKMIYKKKPELNTTLEILHLDKPDTERVSATYQGQLSPYMARFQNKTSSILKKESKKTLQNYAAHAGYLHNNLYQDDFINFKDNNRNLGRGKLFPGVTLLPRKTLPINTPENGYKNKLSNNIVRTLKDDTATEYRVSDMSQFISELQNMYEKNGQTLHPMTQQLVEEHIKHNGNILPTMAGIAGLHAEVQALNQIFIKADQDADKSSESLNLARYAKAMLQSSIFTKRLTTANAGQDFPACHNCSGIIQSPANVITGTVSSAGSNFSKQLAKRNRSQSLS